MTAILTVGGTLIFRGPLGKALAERLTGRTGEGPGTGTGDAEVQQLRHDVEELRAVLAEVQERLDFAERLLVQRREQEPLPAHRRPMNPRVTGEG
ncbi:MAG TPA: hypothetical protein VD793_04250 [Gemmatimonadales bacterium]|nr:hypothetical protein [Gemmatimonadales bacterium]